MVESLREAGCELNAQDLNRECELLVVAEPRKGYAERQANPQGYKNLKVWPVAKDLVKECYRLTKGFPDSEFFGLTRQIRKAAVSITLNIAEGWGRNTKPELARFVDVSMGSLTEVDGAFDLAVDLEFIQREQLEALTKKLYSTGAMLHKLRLVLRSQTR
jgi:four helix bundle protein